jgi:addiction module HigA family antidote
MEMFEPPHPGGLIADILENGDLAIGTTITALAKHLGVTRASLSRVVNGRAAISADMALRLEAALGVKADMWLRLQLKHDLWQAAHKKKRVKVKSLVVMDKAA